MATPAQSFLETHRDRITDLKQTFMSYVKALHA